MLNALAMIAERKISKAIADGDLQIESWKDRPLPQEDNSHVPSDLRMAYKILKNSGYLPPEIESRKEIQQLEELIAKTEDEHTRLIQMKKLNVLLMKLSASRGKTANIAHEEQYHRKIVERISLKK